MEAVAAADASELMTLEFYRAFQKHHVKFAVFPEELPDVIKHKVAMEYDLNESTMMWMNEAYDVIDFNKAWKHQKVPELSIDVRGYKGNALQCWIQEAMVCCDVMDRWDTSPEAADMVMERMSKSDRAALADVCPGEEFKQDLSTRWIARTAVLQALTMRDAEFDKLMDEMKEHSHYAKVGAE